MYNVKDSRRRFCTEIVTKEECVTNEWGQELGVGGDERGNNKPVLDKMNVWGRVMASNVWMKIVVGGR